MLCFTILTLTYAPGQRQSLGHSLNPLRMFLEGGKGGEGRGRAREGGGKSALIHALLHDNEASVRSRGSTEFRSSRQPSPEALSALIHALLHDDVNVRSRAAQSLGHLAHASPEVIKLFLEALQQDEVWSVRRNSAHFLGQIGQNNEQSIQALLHGLLDNNYDVRIACAEALAQSGHDSQMR